MLFSAAALLALANWLRAVRNRASAEQHFSQVRQLSHYMLFELCDQLAREAVSIWTAIARAGLLGARDANKNVPMLRHCRKSSASIECVARSGCAFRI